MDSPKDPESRDWHKQKIMMSVRHDEELEDFRIQQDKEREAARKKFRERLESFGSLVSGDNYSDIVEMIQVNYERDLQRIEEGYQERTREIRKRHRAEETRHRHARLGDRLPVVASPSSPASLPSFPLTQVCYGEPQSKAASPNPWTKFPADPSPVHNQSVQSWRPYSCTVTSETANGHQRLIMRVQSRKRKSLENDYVHVNTKRLRIDTSMNSLKTPVATPPLEPGQAAPERTITFGEVYQDGQAEHKDTIVTWPVGSENFYILKCEEHKVHFKQSPIKGAAKHLNGKFHGIPHRDWNTAIKLLGYRVLDCNEALAARNNRSVDLAFENGYKPQNWMITKRGKARLGSIYRATGTPSSAQVVEQLITPVTASKARHENGVENTPEVGLGIIHSEQTPKRERPPSTVRSTSQRSTNASFRDVTHPKAFHLYYGHWVDRSKNKEEIYPVLVLGWDDLTPGGLPGKNLASTGLLESPPRCYVYNSNGIARWAEGYEDAGPKVNLRKFPVMFFDLGRTVSWLAARDMSKFPLYKAAPKDVNHPFNVARDYIATMEGFDDWNQREEARAASNLQAL
ncbi:hypothetical protein F4778DRAFT_508686 [Xylariomycetidae sp. FL2044]|nr:hypothetical protein F4778DRAFT_508686 [Xylariomycetidae sp. FL2044]